MTESSWCKVAALGAAAYIWPLTDDAPVNLDALLNGYRGGHGFLEVLFKLLTLGFGLLAVREAAKGSHVSLSKKLLVFLVAIAGVLLANVDDFALVIPPLHFMREEEIWDPANLSTKLAGAVTLYLAGRLALARGPAPLALESRVFKKGSRRAGPADDGGRGKDIWRGGRPPQEGRGAVRLRAR